MEGADKALNKKKWLRHSTAENMDTSVTEQCSDNQCDIEIKQYKSFLVYTYIYPNLQSSASAPAPATSELQWFKQIYSYGIPLLTYQIVL